MIDSGMIECVRLLTENDFLFAESWRLYESAFPVAERRSLRWHTAAMTTAPDFYCYALHNDEGFVGILFYWLFSDCVYVEHLAIAEGKRGQGYGAAALRIAQQHRLPVILEIEPVQDEDTARRLRFYENAGYRCLPFEHYQLPYHLGESALRLILLSYPEPANAQLIESFEQDFHTRPMLFRDAQ